MSADALASLDTAAVAVPLDLDSASDSELGDYLELAGELMSNDNASAAKVLSEIGRAGQDRGLLDVAGEAAYRQARATLNQGQLPEALDLINRASDLWLACGEPLKAARTALGRMNVLDDLGRHHDAIDVGQQLLLRLDELDTKYSDSDGHGDSEELVWLRAAALENIGVGQGYLGQHAAALEAYRKAEQVYRTHGLEDEVPRPMANRGVELVEMGQLEDAITALRTAAIDFDRQGDNLFTAKCLAYEARAQMLRGNYVASAAATERAAQYLEGQDTSTEYARTQLVRSETLTSMNLLDQALRLLDSLVAQFASAGLEHDLAAAYFGRAVALTKLGRRHAAMEAFIEAESRYAAVGDTPMAAVARLGRSELAESDAQSLARSALDSLAKSGRPADHAAAELRMSQLAASASDALVHLDRAEEVLERHGLPHLRWKLLAERGRRLRELGDTGGARYVLEAAIAGLDEMRRTVDQDLQRLPFMGGRDRVHQELAALLLDIGDVAGAYELSEHARARTLVERMQGELSAVAVDHGSAELDALYSQLLQVPGLRSRSLREEARALESLSGSSVPRQPVSSADHLTFDTVTYQIVGDELMAFVSDGALVRAVRNLATIEEVQKLIDRLDVQWRRFSDPGLVARQQTHLVAATKDVL